MTLPEYLATQQLSESAFARILGVRSSTIHRWLNTKTKAGVLRRPSMALLPRIERVTGGKVKPRDFYPAAEAAE